MNLDTLLLENRLAAADHQPLTPCRLKRGADDIIEGTWASQDQQPLATSKMTCRTITIDIGTGGTANASVF
jgi:hypothetical protein